MIHIQIPFLIAIGASRSKGSLLEEIGDEIWIDYMEYSKDHLLEILVNSILE